MPHPDVLLIIASSPLVIYSSCHFSIFLNINIKTEKPEFLEWKWIDLDMITEVAVDFKFHVYKELKEKIKTIIN